MPVLKCKNLSFSYIPGQNILNNLSFGIRQGEYVACVGANGSGKSTLARHFNGLLLPDTGTVCIGGLSTSAITDIPEIRRNVGMVFQIPDSQIVGTSVETDLAFALENIGLPRTEIQNRINDTLDHIGLNGFEYRNPASLSAGEQQKLAIGCMIALNPDIIVFDEATSMIDPASRKEILGLIRSLHDKGRTVICITHDMDEAYEADRILHLHQGEIVNDLSPRDFFRQTDLPGFHLSLPRVQKTSHAVSGILPQFSYQGNSIYELKNALDAILPEKLPVPDSASEEQNNGQETCIIECISAGFIYLRDTDREQTGLKNVNMKICKGEIVGIAGPTGSGKSTLLQHINGLLIPEEGRIDIFGQNTADRHTDLRAIRRRVGLAFQRPEKQLFKTYTGDDIAFGLEERKLAPEHLARTVAAAMKKAGLSYAGFKDRPVSDLSGGEKRKAALSGVLVTEPEILLLDEPTSGLDPVSREEIIAVIRREKESGTTVLFTTHDYEVLGSLAERVIYMRDGKILFDGSPGRFFEFVSPETDTDLLPVAASLSLDQRFAKRGMQAFSDRGLVSTLEGL